MKAISVVLLCGVVVGSCLCFDLIALIGMQPLEVGTTAPEFTLPDIDGKQASLSDFEDQIVLLNFWSPT
jgi:hypothetical protein